MALDFQFPQAQPLKGGLSTPVPISLGTKREGPPTVVSVDIGWADYGASSTRPIAVEVDLTQAKVTGPVFDQIRSIYIDNSFSFVPIYVKFPDTGFIIICPANSILQAPVFTNSTKKFVVYAQDFIDTSIPVTTIFVSNVELAGFVVGTGQFTPPVIPPSVARVGDYPFVVNGTVTNTINVGLGTIDATRIIYVAVACRSVSVASIDISAVSLGGSPMTLMLKKNSTTGGGQVQVGVVGIYALAVAAGATAVLSITASQIPDIVRAQVFSAYHLTAPLVNVGSNSASGAAIGPLALATFNPGVAVAAGCLPFTHDVTGISNPLTAGLLTAAAQLTTGAALGIGMASGYNGAVGSSLVGISVK